MKKFFVEYDDVTGEISATWFYDASIIPTLTPKAGKAILKLDEKMHLSPDMKSHKIKNGKLKLKDEE